MPGTDVPGIIDIPYLDKWVHIGLFFALSFLWKLWLDRPSSNQSRSKVLLFFILLLYGMVIELIQHTMLPTRSADPWDIVANAVGILLGIWAATALGPKRGLKV